MKDHAFLLKMTSELWDTVTEMARTDKRTIQATLTILIEAAIKEKNRKKKKTNDGSRVIN